MLDDPRALVNHYLAALAYRSAKALRDAPPGFGTFSAAMTCDRRPSSCAT